MYISLIAGGDTLSDTSLSMAARGVGHCAGLVAVTDQKSAGYFRAFESEM